MSQINLAIVDIEPFIHGDGTVRRRVARAFGDAFETTGFAVVVGHGVSETLANDTYEAMKAFFAQPYQDKLAWSPPEKAKGRGYLPVGIESVAKTLTGETPPDLCEALVFSAPHREDKPGGRPNIWPTEPAGISGLVEDWTQAMLGLTGHLSRLSALALDLPETYFDPFYADPALTLRFVHYPDQETPPRPGQMRYGEHHDYGALTVLRQDSAPGGLQIMDLDGEWKEAGVVPNSFVINVGDLMARWTNDRWVSTMHRVVNPTPEEGGMDRRQSLAFFHQPNWDAEIACLDECLKPGEMPKYAPVRSGPYLMGKFQATTK